MRNFAASIIILAAVLIGALPVAAGPSSIEPGSGAAIRVADAADTTADRDTYTHQAQDQMREWQRKFHDFNATAGAKGKEAGAVAENDLNKAWTEVEAASHRLQTAGAEGWESAKASYEKASDELAGTWRKVHPGDK
jgi:hypothetical protein